MQTTRYTPSRNPFEAVTPKTPEIPVSQWVEAVLGKFQAAESSLPREDAVALVARVFEHSSEDGIKMAERLKLTPEELFDACASGAYALKHPRIFGQILSFARQNKDKLPGELKQLERAEQIETAPGEAQALKLTSSLAKEMYQEVDAAYTVLLKERKIKAKEVGRQDEREPEELAENFLAKIDLALQGGYYAGPVRDVLEKRLDAKQLKSKKWKDWAETLRLSSVATTTELDQLCRDFSLDADALKQELRKGKYILYGDLVKYEKIIARSAVQKQVEEMLGEYERLELNPETNRFEIVEKEGAERKLAKQELDFSQYEKIESPIEVSGQLFFRAKQNGRWFIVNAKGERSWEGYDDACDPIEVSGQLFFRAKQNGRWFIVNAKGERSWEGYDDACDPIEVSGQLFFRAKQNGRWFIVNAKGERSWEGYDGGVESPAEINRQLYFVAWQKNKSFITNTKGEKFGEGYEAVGHPTEINGQLFFLAMKNQNSFIANTKGEKFGERYEEVRFLTEISGELYFCAKEGGRWFITNAKGERFGEEYTRVGPPTEVNSRLFFKALKDGKSFITNAKGERFGEEYDDVGDPTEFEGKLAYPAKKDGKLILVIEDVKKRKKAPVESEAGDRAFQDKAVEYLQKLLDEGGSIHIIMEGLAGLDSPRAWEMREKLINEGADMNKTARGLVGIDTPRAWELREKMLKDGISKNLLAETLAGLDSPQAWEMRERLLKMGANVALIAQGLAGLDTPRAWGMRERMLVIKNDNSVMISLAGLDTPQAWKMRERLRSKGSAEAWTLVTSLAGLDSPKAWEMRDELMKHGVERSALAESLIGLDSPQAWEIREKLSKESDKEVLALSLCGLNSPRAWQIRKELEKQGVAKHLIIAGISGNVFTAGVRKALADKKGETRKKETLAEFDARDRAFQDKAVEYLNKMLDEGANNYVAQGLAGLDSPQAWEMRKKLLEMGLDTDYIAQGLAGLNSPQAWEMRKKHLDEGYHSSVAQGLAGLDSPQAWEMRKKLLEEGANKGNVVLSLAGLDSPQAWEMRRKLLDEGASKGNVALGLAGLDSPQAWEMRRKLLEEGADKGWVAIGLAGLDSPQTWEMRRKLLDEGVDKSWVAIGLVGLDSPQAWEMRRKLLGADMDYVAQSLAGLDSPQAWEMRRKLLEEGADKGWVAIGVYGDYLMAGVRKAWRDKLVAEQGIDERSKKLNLLNLVHDPDEEGIRKFFEEREKSEAERRKREQSLVEQSKHVAEVFNRLLREVPDAFLATMGARRDRASEILAQKMISRMFPAIYEREQNRRGGGGDWFGFLGERSGESSGAGPEDYLSTKQFDSFEGGGREQMDDEREVMEFRDPVSGLVVTGLFGKYEGARWGKSYIPLNRKPLGVSRETTVTLPHVRRGQDILLPKPLDSAVIAERVRGIKRNGEEVELKPEEDSLGESKIRDLPSVEKVAYSINLSQESEPMAPVSLEEYNQFRAGLVRVYGRDMVTPLAPLPEEVDAFLNSDPYLRLSPRERVMAIERFVRASGFYDFDNQEMAGYKRGKSIEDKMMLSEMRIEELRARKPDDPDLVGRRWAGVCADFAEILSTVLRRAGFASGVAQGFALHDEKTAKVKAAHATAFVVWPDGLGGMRAVIADGTPGGNDPRLRYITLPTLEEREKTAEKDMEAALEESNKELDEILRTIASGDVEAIRKLENGKLENTLNVVLSRGVKKSHLEMVREMLNFYWYGGLDRLAENVQSMELKKTMEGYLTKRRGQQGVGAAQKPAGTELFETVSAFAERFQKSQGRDYAAALDKLDSVTELAKGELDPMELRAMTAVITYLRGKNMAGHTTPGPS